jgi:hypothetical protein
MRNYLVIKPFRNHAGDPVLVEHHFFDDTDYAQREEALRLAHKMQDTHRYMVAVWKHVRAQGWEFISEVGEYVPAIFQGRAS